MKEGAWAEQLMAIIAVCIAVLAISVLSRPASQPTVTRTSIGAIAKT